MTQTQMLLLQDPKAQHYTLPRLKLLPVREQPGYRVAKDPDAAICRNCWR